MGSPLRAFVRIVAYLGLTGLLLPVQLFAVQFNRRLSISMPLFYHRVSARILVIVTNDATTSRALQPALFALVTPP